jgi:hypothetical protein
MSKRDEAAIDVLAPSSSVEVQQPADIVAHWLKRSSLVLEQNERDAMFARYVAFKHVFGAAPILSGENRLAYEFILLDLLDRYRPKSTDVVIASLIAQLLDSIWEIKRCTRHKKLVVDLEHERWLRRRAKRRAAKPSEIWIDFDDSDDTLEDVDISLVPPPTERDDARALQMNMGHYCALDIVMQRCLRSYERALDMLELYAQPEFSGAPGR